MTTIIRADAAHDLLALVPALIGHAPMRSLVCIAFRGNRSAGVLRYDLPGRARDRDAVASAMVGTVCRMPGVDAIVPIAYTEATFARRGAMPERALLELVAARAESAGFVVRDAFCVAGDGWGSVLDPQTPAQGHPLEMITCSPAASDARCGVPDPAGAAGLAALPEPDADLATRVADLLDACAADDRVDAFGRRRRPRDVERLLDGLGALTDPVELVEALLDADPADVGADRLAWLVHLTGRPAFRDAMMLQFAFGPAIGAMALDDAMDANERAAEHGEDVGELVAREWSQRGAETVAGLLTRLLLGESSTRPEPDRIERAIAVLRRALAHAPERHRPGPLCVAAWLAWALGRGSAAGAFVERALEIDPAHTMSGLLHAYLGTGAIPEWAFADGDDAGGASADEVSDP
ncbi:DUF4192 family protein [Agromyces sp. H66]|uniref:DUF4192 family protein n=1 Tax=Agromyces sp. H66 TaxID=2529859 RepID=UPI00145BC52A|nr:DUF4192 family protein [Agromyces sp. H66]